MSLSRPDLQRGARNWYVYSMVTFQSFWVSVSGLLVGLLLAIVAGQLAHQQVAEFIRTNEAAGVAATLSAVLLMSAIAAILPVRRIAGIDPAIVFRP